MIDWLAYGAEQAAVLPWALPWQLQPQAPPVPVTALAVPVVHSVSSAGAVALAVVSALPQTPSSGVVVSVPIGP